MQKEIWKSVKGREEFYEVSNTGKVRSLVNRYKTKGIFELSIYANAKGYQAVDLAKPTLKKYSVHRLVAEAFCEKPEHCNVVNHIDNNPSNNHYTNLEWTTYSGNLHHAQNQGRLFKAQSKGGKVTGDKATKRLQKATDNMVDKRYGELTILAVGSTIKYGNANRPKLVAQCACGTTAEYYKIQLEKGKVTCCKKCSGNKLGFSRREQKLQELKGTVVGNLKFTGNSTNTKNTTLDKVKVEFIDLTTDKLIWKSYKQATSKRFLNKHKDIV